MKQSRSNSAQHGQANIEQTSRTEKSAPRLRLITRGDDAGSCHAANHAILEACERGIVRNVSLMAPGPAFDEAAQLFRNRPELCLGLHVTLNAEWEEATWRPVLPVARVPSLLDENGDFTSSPLVLHQRGFGLDEAMAEVRAQLGKARAHGLNIQYLDEHMGVGWLGDLRERLAALCEREGLVDAHPIASLPPAKTQSHDLVERWSAQVQAASPGAYVLVTHPGQDDEEMRRFYTAGQQAGEVARERDAERRALCDPRWPRLLHEAGVELARYAG